MNNVKTNNINEPLSNMVIGDLKNGDLGIGDWV